MSIQIMTITSVQCDGTAEMPCPHESVKVYEYPQMISLRLARKEGWVIEEVVMCPTCGTGESATAELKPAPVRHMRTRMIPERAARAEQRPCPGSQAASRSMGSSSASCS